MSMRWRVIFTGLLAPLLLVTMASRAGWIEDKDGKTVIHLKIYENSAKGLVEAYRRRKKLLYTLQPKAQFIVRADEFAFFMHGFRDGAWQIAPWMTGRSWNSGYKTPRGRIEWEQMVLSNDVALRYRVKEVTQTVATGFSQR